MGGVRNVAAELGRVTEHWSPRVIARANDQLVKLAKVRGEFVWHSHEHEDELFHVLRGRLTRRFRDGEVTLGEGDVFVVPKGVMHQPYAEEECWLMLVEPAATKHTGDVDSPLTKSIEAQMASLAEPQAGASEPASAPGG